MASDLRAQTADLLADVELELRHSDSADDQIGQHAATMEDKLQGEIGKRAKRLGPAANDPAEEAEYLRLLRMKRQARVVGGLADEAKRRR